MTEQFSEEKSKQLYLNKRRLITDPIIHRTSETMESYLDGFQGYLTSDLSNFFGDKTIPYVDLLTLSHATIAKNKPDSIAIDPKEGSDFKEIHEQSRIIMGTIPNMRWGLPIPDYWISDVFLKAPSTNEEYLARIAELKGTIYDLATARIKPGTPVRSSLALFRTYAYFNTGEQLSISTRH